MAFLTDTYTDTAGTDATAHTPDSGGSISKHPNSDGGYAGIISDANRLRASTAAPLLTLMENLHIYSVVPSSPNYRLSGSMRWISEHDSLKVAVRVHATNSTAIYLIFYFDGDDGNVHKVLLRKIVGASVTAISSYTIPGGTTGVDYDFEIEVDGDDVAVAIAGVADALTATVADVTDGLIGVAPGARSNALGPHLNGIVAEYLEGGDEDKTGTDSITFSEEAYSETETDGESITFSEESVAITADIVASDAFNFSEASIAEGSPLVESGPDKESSDGFNFSETAELTEKTIFAEDAFVFTEVSRNLSRPPIAGNARIGIDVINVIDVIDVIWSSIGAVEGQGLFGLDDEGDIGPFGPSFPYGLDADFNPSMNYLYLLNSEGEWVEP